MLVKRFHVTVGQNSYSWNGGQQQTMVIREVCPQCKSFRYKKNGHIHHGKQNHHCHDCGRQFVQCFEALPDHLHVQPVTCKQNVMIQRLEVEADEMASVVHKKANKRWIWIAMDATSRQVIAFRVGGRRRKSAKRLWTKIPHAYRQHACFTRISM
jgi:insertion element IS1 protein InsB